jgi:hypothetical protein
MVWDIKDNMDHLLKSSRIKQTMQMDVESAREIESFDQILADLAKLSEELKSNSVHDQRQTMLEGIMLRIKDAMDHQAQMDDKEDSAKVQEMSRMHKMCADMQSEIDSLKAERLADANVIGSSRAETAKYMVMCDAEKRARVIAEDASAAKDILIAKQNETILELAKQDTVEDTGWHVVPVRDAAENTLRYEVKKQ